MTIKITPQLCGEDAQSFIEEAERNSKLPIPKISLIIYHLDFLKGYY